MIEKIIPNVKKCYTAPEVKILGVEEEYILEGGSIHGGNEGTGQGEGTTPGGHAKQFGLIIDDEETED